MGLPENKIAVKILFDVFKKKTNLDFYPDFEKKYNNIEKVVAKMTKDQKSEYDIANYIKEQFEQAYQNMFNQVLDSVIDAEYANNLNERNACSISEFFPFMQQVFCTMSKGVIERHEINTPYQDTKAKNSSGEVEEKYLSTSADLDDYYMAVHSRLRKEYPIREEYRDYLKARDEYHFSNMLANMNGFIEKLTPNNGYGTGDHIMGNFEANDPDTLDNVDHLLRELELMEAHYNSRFFLSRWLFGGKEREAIANAKATLAPFVENKGVDFDTFKDKYMENSEKEREIFKYNTNHEVEEYDGVDMYVDNLRREKLLEAIVEALYEPGVQPEVLHDMLKYKSWEELTSCYKQSTGEDYKEEEITFDEKGYDKYEPFEPELPDYKEEEMHLRRTMKDLYRMQHKLSEFDAYVLVSKHSVYGLKQDYKKIMRRDYEEMPAYEEYLAQKEAEERETSQRKNIEVDLEEGEVNKENFEPLMDNSEIQKGLNEDEPENTNDVVKANK